MDRDAYVGFRSRRAIADHATLVRVYTSEPALESKHLSLRRLFLHSGPVGAALYSPDCAGASTASTIRFASVSAVAIACRGRGSCYPKTLCGTSSRLSGIR